MKKILFFKMFAGVSVLFIYGFSLVFISCSKETGAAEEEAALPVRIVPVTIRETADEVNGFGSISFFRKYELLSPLEGILENLRFREGDRIKKGDEVAVLNNPQVSLAARRAEDARVQAKAALDLALARLRDSEFNAEARILENEKLHDELVQAKIILEEERRKSRNREAVYEAGGMSEEAIREERFRLASAETQVFFMEKEEEIRSVGFREEDLRASGIPVSQDRNELRKSIVRLATSALRAEAAAARANLEAATREMESCGIAEKELRITSPGTGTVGARYVETGERIRRDDRIITVMETDSLCAFFPVSESEALKLKKGMTALVSSGGDEIREGKVDLISPQADIQSFTFMVRILLSPLEGSPLKPGMFARVSIPLENPRKITTIPEAALAGKEENSGKVFVIRNNILSGRDVVLGPRRGDEREIISGLAPGEVIVLGPDPAFKDGVYVSAAE